MSFKDFKQRLKYFGLHAAFLQFTNYADNICIYCNNNVPTMDGVDLDGKPVIEMATVNPDGVGKFTINHPLSLQFVNLVRMFANTQLKDR